MFSEFFKLPEDITRNRAGHSASAAFDHFFGQSYEAFASYSRYERDERLLARDGRKALGSLISSFNRGTAFSISREEDMGSVISDKIFGSLYKEEDAETVDDEYSLVREAARHKLTSLTRPEVDRLGTSARQSVDDLLSRVDAQLLPTVTDAYIDRPGIAPIISLFDNAEKEIDIDLYQLQNKAVSDVLYSKLKDNPEISLNIRLANPEGSNETGWSILGPNLFEVEKLKQLKEEREKLSQFGEVGEINIVLADRKSHPKVYVNEHEGYIGTANITSPMGSNPEQAGSNYESIRYLTKGRFELSDDKTELLRDGIEPVTELGADTSSAKLFFQLKDLTGRIASDPEGKNFFTGLPNIGGAGDIYEHLQRTLHKATESGHLAMVLNQPFLLQHEGSIYEEQAKGEMGPWKDDYRPSDEKTLLYREQQSKLMDLLIEGRASVIVDNRNYFSRVLEPLYKKLEYVEPEINKKGLSEWVRSNDIEGSALERVSNLSQKFGISESFSRQLLAVTSGNINLSTVPMMHVKSYGLFSDKSLRELDSYALGSSNFGMYSTYSEGDDPDRINREHGILLDRSANETGPLGLSSEETDIELSNAASHMRYQFQHLGAGNAWWEDKVNRTDLNTLHSSLKTLTEIMEGVDVEWTYGKRGDRTGVAISLSAASYGLNRGDIKYRFTTLNGGMGDSSGMIYMLDQNRYISESILSNQTDKLKEVKRLIGDEWVDSTIAPDDSIKLSPIQTVTNLVGTAFTEIATRGSSVDITPDRAVEYLHKYSGVNILDMNATDWRTLSINLMGEMWGGAPNKLFGYGDNARQAWERFSEDLDMVIASEDPQQRDNSLKYLVGSFIDLAENLPTLKADINRRVGHQSPKDVNTLSKSLFEPFLLGGQVSTYSGSQAMNRLPLYQTTDYEGAMKDYVFQPLSYRPATNFGSAARGAVRNVADGGSTSKVSEAAQLTFLGGETGSVGTILDKSVLESFGIARENKLEDIERSLEAYKQLGIDTSSIEDRLKESIGTITYTFGGAGKVAQIPQRLKNVGGQRGMLPISSSVADLIDIDIANKTSSLNDYIENYKSALESRLDRALSSFDEPTRELFKDKYFQDTDIRLGAVYSAKLRTVLGSDQFREIESYRNQLSSYLEDEELIEELVRIRAVRQDLLATGLKGFTGSDKKQNFVAVQLTGSFSDYSYANEEYWTRQGFAETTTKRVKATMLSAKTWTKATNEILDDRLKASIGDYVAYDEASRKVVVISGKTDKIKRALEVGVDLSQQDIIRLYGVLMSNADSRGQRSVLEGVIDNVSRDMGFPSMSDLDTKAWNRPAEDGVELLLDVKRPQGGAGNQLFYDFVYSRSVLPGGSRRVEGAESGGLFKAPQIMVQSQPFENIARIYNATEGGTFADIESREISSIASTSNLKSYFPSHGASILADKDNLDRLFKSFDDRQIATALTLAFGGDFYSGDNRDRALEIAGRNISEGVLGERYKQLAAIREMSAGGLGSMFDKSQFNLTQTPILSALSSEILNALSGLQSNMGDTLRNYLEEGVGKSLNLGDRNATERGQLVAALDLVKQLGSGMNMQTIDFPSNDIGALRKAASTMGFTPQQIESEEFETTIAPRISAYVKQSPVVLLQAALAASSSKEPIGSKLTGSLEYQHMVQPVYNMSREFQKTGDVSKAVGLLLASTSVTDTEATLGLKNINARSVASMSPVFAGLEYMAAYGSRGNASYTKMEEFSKYVKDLFTQAGETGDKDLLKKVVDITKPSDLAGFNVDWQDWQSAFDEIETRARYHATEVSKAFGIGEVSAMLDSANYKGGLFSMPELVMLGTNEDGTKKIGINRDKQNYAFIASPQMLKQLGAQFGEFTPELIRSTLLLAGGFTPGTASNKLIKELAKAQLDDRSTINLTTEAAQSAMQYQEKFLSISDLIADVTSATTAKKAMGGENRMKGGVVTAAASHAIPEGAMFVPGFAVERSGGGDIKYSERFMALERVDDILTSYSHLSSTPVLKLVTSIKDQASTALIEGIGQAGQSILDSTNAEGLKFQTQINNLSSIGNPLDQRNAALDIYYEMAQAKSNLSGLALGKTDRFARDVANLHFISIASQLSKYLDAPINDINADRQKAFARQYESLTMTMPLSQQPLPSLLSLEGVSIGDRTISDLEGAIRPNTNINYLDLSRYRDIDNDGLLEIAKSRIKSSIVTFEDTLNHISAVEQSRGINAGQQTMMDESRSLLSTGLDKLRELDQIKTTDPGKLAAKLNTLLVQYDVSDTSQVLAFRSAPFGGQSQHRQIFSVISSINTLNRYIEGNMNGGELARLSETRNKSLGLVNPLSLVTTNLGDHDGDPYTFVFTAMSDYHRRLEKIDERINLTTITTEGGDRDYKLSLLQKQKEEVYYKLGQIEKGLLNTYSTDIKNEVSNYLGLSLDRLENIGPDIAVTFLQQGYGLFSGLEDKADPLTIVSNVFKDFEGREDLLSPTHWKQQGQEYVQGLVDKAKGPEVSYYQAILEKEFVRDEMFKQMSTSKDYIDAATTFLRQSESFSELQSYLGKGAGVDIDMDVYDTVVKVLGKAGSDVLGKTYNTLVGTLFMDSPLLALGSVVRDNKDSIRSHLVDGLGRTQDEADNYIHSVEGRTQEAIETQGFVKSIQQLLRDSIKFKSKSGILDSLRDKAKRYETADDRDALLRDLAGDLGFGPGLRPLLELDSLARIQGDSILNRRGALEAEDLSMLSKEFSISSLDEYKQWEQSTSKLFNGRQVTLQEVLNYKVGRGLENMAIAFSHASSSSTVGSLYQGDAQHALDNYGDRIREIWGDDHGFDDNELKKAALFIEDRKTPKFIGDDYQGLSKFLSYINIDRNVRASMKGVDTVLSTLPEVLVSLRGTLASGKLSPESINSSVFSMLNAVGGETDRKEIIKKIYESSADFDETTLALLSGEGGEFTATSGKGRITRDSFADFFKDILKDSALSKQSETLKSLVDSFNDLAGGGNVKEVMEERRAVDLKADKTKTVQMLTDKPVSETLDLHTTKANQRSLTEAIAQAAMMDSIDTAKPLQLTPRIDLIQDSHKRVVESAQKVNDGLDLGLSAGLTLLGGLIATGRIEGDALTEVASNTLVSIGYMRDNNKLSSLMGMGFRAKLAKQSSEEDWFATYIAQEAGYRLGASIAQPAVKAISDIALSGASKLNKIPMPDITGAMKYRPLDMDRYAAWKGGAQTLSGALLTAVMGSVGASIGRRVAKGLGQADMSYLASLSKNVQEKNRRYEEKVINAMADQAPVDSEGNPLEAALQVSLEIDDPLADREFFNPEELEYATSMAV